MQKCFHIFLHFACPILTSTFDVMIYVMATSFFIWLILLRKDLLPLSKSQTTIYGNQYGDSYQQRFRS